jgi:DNA-binding beta-propeller fold protein YncE
VLAISPDGNRVVVSDGNSVPPQVYIFNGSSTPTAPIDLILPIGKATAAAFSPDEMKIFILTDAGIMYIYSSVDAMRSVPIALLATDVTFSADGSFAYVAGANSVSAIATCDLTDIGGIGRSSTPLKIFPAPDVQDVVISPTQSQVTQNLLALEPPNIQLLKAQFIAGMPLKDGVFTCNAPSFSISAASPINLGQGNFIPLYMRVVGNGSQVIVVAKNIPAVLVVNVNQNVTTPIALVNNGLPRAASSSTDGSQVFVAACDAFTNNDPTQPCTSGSVHIINTLSGGDVQQVPYVNIPTNNSMCNQPNAPPCFPNLIAIRPQ